MSGWRSRRFSGRRTGALGIKLKSWLRTMYEKKGSEGLHFTIREMMNDLEMDYSNYYERTRVSSFIQKERSLFYDILSEMHTSGEYGENKEAGFGEKEIFDMLVKSALSHNIYPVWADKLEDGYGNVEYRYFLFNFQNFVEFTKQRMQNVETQLKHKGEVIASLESQIPNIGEQIQPLRIEGESRRLITANTIEICPWPDCGKKFKGVDPMALVNDHIRKKHAPEREEAATIDDFDCPLCGAKARPNLYRKLEGHMVKTHGEHGNFKCNECKAFIDEEEIIGLSSR